MPYPYSGDMRILVFLHGTTIMQAAGIGHTRAERVRQVVDHDPTVRDFASYVPIGRAADKLTGWFDAGAQIVYLSSHRDEEGVEADASVLERHGFPPGPVAFRAPHESYTEVVARVAPDLLIEDDCESIGGAPEMTYPNLPSRLQAMVHSIVVAEFGGIDSLPDEASQLLHRP